MAKAEPICMSSEDLEGHRYSVEYRPENDLIVVHEIVSAAAVGAPILAARGRWTKDHVSWDLNRLGPGKAATVASVLAPHLVVADDSKGASSGWEGPCPICSRTGGDVPSVIKATFGEALRGGTARCSNGHLVRLDDPDGRVARNIFLINDMFSRPTTSTAGEVGGKPAEPGPFQVKKMFNRGTDSPIVQRIFLQFLAVLESGALTLDAKAINGVKSLLFESMRDFGHVQDAVDAYIRHEDESLAGLNGGGVRITHNAVFYDDPTVELRKLFGDVVTSAVIALRNLPRLAAAILGVDLDGGKSWKKLRILLTASAKRQEPGSKDVDDFYRWSEELADLRGRFEHPHPPLEITPVRVDVQGGTLRAVHPPHLVQPSRSLRQYIEPVVPLAIDHVERMIALLLGERCVAGYRIERYNGDVGAGFRFAPVKIA